MSGLRIPAGIAMLAGGVVVLVVLGDLIAGIALLLLALALLIPESWTRREPPS